MPSALRLFPILDTTNTTLSHLSPLYASLTSYLLTPIATKQHYKSCSSAPRYLLSQLWQPCVSFPYHPVNCSSHSLTLSFTVIFYYRHRIASLIPSTSPLQAGYTRLTTFSSQAAAGLTSGNFDLEENNLQGDSRLGLDEAGVSEVHDIMQRQGVSYVQCLDLCCVTLTYTPRFDEARLIRHKRILRDNGIDPSGTWPFDIALP